MSLNVLKTSAKSVDHEMSHDNPSSILNRTTEDMLSSEEFTQPFLWLHLGVNENSTGFAIEAVAHNEATFRVPDECDFQPMKEAIVPSDGDYMQCRSNTSLISLFKKYMGKENSSFPHLSFVRCKAK